MTVERTNTAGSGHHCNVVSWSDLVVNVQCFDASGSPADTAFYAHLQRERADAPTVAFAWANDATGASYSPISSYVSNPGGGPVTASRTSAGVYSIHFAGFASVGVGAVHPQVSTYGEDDRRCSVSGWSSETVSIRCFDASGAPADTRYSVLFRKRHSTMMTRGFAAARVTNSSMSHTIDPDIAWNPRGVGTARGPVQFTRNGTGDYDVTFEGFGALGDDGGVALVTAHWSNAYCKVVGWFGDTVSVLCFQSEGLPQDSSFDVVYLKPDAGNETLGYVWKSDASAAFEIANPTYAHNPSGGQISTAKLGTGLYRVTFTGIGGYGHNEGLPIVTGYGSSSDRCQLVYWNGDEVDVACFASDGSPQDSRFALVWFKPDQSTDGVAAALADLPAEPVYTALASKSHHPFPGVPATLYRHDTGLYELTFGDLREMGLEKYGLLSTVGETSARCAGRMDFGSLDVDCDTGVHTSIDTAYTGVILAPIRLPEPGQASMLAAGLGALLWMWRHRSRHPPIGT